MKTILNILKLSLLSLLFVACNQTEKEEHKTSEKPMVETILLKSDTLKYELNLPGDLKPYDQVTLYAKVEGFIDEMSVDRGDKVEKGEVLARIDAPEIEQQYLAAKSRERELLQKLNFSSENYRSLKEAAETEGAVSSIELEQAKARFIGDSASLNAAKAEVAASKQLNAYRTIKAPFKGVITKRMISPGALVGPGQEESLFHLSREDKLRLEVAVPEKHGASIPLGSKSFFRVNNKPNERFPIKIARSSEVLDPELRSLMVEFDVDNPDFKLSSGSYAEVDLNLNRSYPTLQVPQSSLVKNRKDVFVAKVKDNKVELVPVITGVSTSEEIEVFGDLNRGDQIIEEGNTTLKDGMEVRVKK